MAVTTPVKSLEVLASVMSPVVDVSVVVPSILRGPVWTMLPTDVAVRSPVKVVVPKVVMPPEIVVRSTAAPVTDKSPEEAIDTLAPEKVTRPRRSFLTLARIISAGVPPCDAVAEAKP